MKKILIVIPFGIGDTLFTTPMITALKEKFPQAAISYLTSTRAALFLKNDPRLLKVFTYDRDEFVAVYKKSPWQFVLKWKKFIDDLKGEQFDLAFDLSLNSGIGLALKMAGIPRRIGYDHKGRGRFLTESIALKGYAARHVAEHHFDLLRLVGIDKVPGETRFFPSSADQDWAENLFREKGLKEGNVIGFFLGGGASWGQGGAVRRWPSEHYAELAEKLIEKTGLPIILIGSPKEEEACLSVADGMAGNPVIASRTSLGEAAALMQRCRFVVLNDGGPLHIAAGVGAKTVVFFGPVDPVAYGPYPPQGHIVVTKGLPCQPCYRNFRMSDCPHASCLKTLTVDEVFRKVKDFL